MLFLILLEEGARKPVDLPHLQVLTGASESHFALKVQASGY